MIKIKNYILNENELLGIVYIKEENKLELISKDKYSEFIKNATFEDIEWNYGEKQVAPRIRQLEAKIERKRKEHERKIKKLKEEYITLEKDYGTSEIENDKLRKRINKAIEYIEKTIEKKKMLLPFISYS